MKIDKDNFKKNLGLAEIPQELEKLIDFQNNESDFESYSQGFGVYIDDKSLIRTWSEDANFLDNILQFAQANGSGSSYAIWKDGTNKPLNEMPIVVFGDEGGVHVVAENILQLLQILTFDSEISVYHEEAYFYKDNDDHADSRDSNSYKVWLKTNFNLEGITNPSDLVTSAQKKYQETFNKWLKQYYKDA